MTIGRATSPRISAALGPFWSPFRSHYGPRFGPFWDRPETADGPKTLRYYIPQAREAAIPIPYHC